MRSAYKVWSGIAAATFVLVAVVDGAGSPTPASATATPAPVFAPTGVVATVQGWANVTLADGRRIHIPMLNGTVNASDDCDRQASMELATSLLAGKQVRLQAPPRMRDAVGVAPAGWVEADITVGAGDYASAFKAQQAHAWYQRCAPASWSESPTSTSPAPASPSDGDVDVDHGDTNHRDGALTGGYCRKKWWC